MKKANIFDTLFCNMDGIFSSCTENVKTWKFPETLPEDKESDQVLRFQLMYVGVTFGKNMLAVPLTLFPWWASEI